MEQATNITFIAAAASRSEQLNELGGALAKAQSEMSLASLDAENPFFKSKYADLGSIVKVSRPPLTKNGLAVTQQIITNDEGQAYLYTMLIHASGQWLSSQMRIAPSKPDVQSMGGYITYLRRYAYAALIGVVTGDDDDGNDDAQSVKSPSPKPIATPRIEFITDKEAQELDDMIGDRTEIAESIFKHLKINSLNKIPRDRYIGARDYIVTNIKAIKGE